MGAFLNLISSLVNLVEVWDDGIFARRYYELAQVRLDYDALQKLRSHRAVRLVRLCGESLEFINRVDPNHHGQQLLALIIMSENLELLELVIDKGINLNARYIYQEKCCKDGQFPGMSVLHYASMRTNVDVMKLLVQSSALCPSCDRTNDGHAPIQFACCRLPVLKFLIHDCFVDVASADSTDWNALHRTAMMACTQRRVGDILGRPFDCAMLLLEGDFQRAIKGEPWFNVKSTETLLTTRGSITGMTALEWATSSGCQDSDFVELLRGWESSPLATPPPASQTSSATSLMFNPQLTPFQRFLARGVHDLLNVTAIHSVAYQVLGYLSPMDALSNWNEWREDIATPNPIRCYCCSLRNKYQWRM